MDFKNLYALLKIKPTASQSDIAKAMRQAAQQQTITLDDLKLCKQYLLNEEERTKYDERLFAAHPELLAPPPEPKPEPEPEPEKAEEAEPLAPAKTKQSNKKLYLILIIAVAAIALIAGTVAYIKHFKPIAEAKEAVRDLLKDPDSAKFYDVKTLKNTKDKQVYVCGEVNAKVPAGGYGGKERFVYIPYVNTAYIIPDKKPELPGDEMVVSVYYRVGCLNDDLYKLKKDMENNAKDYAKYADLVKEKYYTYHQTQKEILEQKIQPLAIKIVKQDKELSIYQYNND